MPANITSPRFFKILFHIFFWGIWLFLPFIGRTFDNEMDAYFLKVIFPVTLIHIPLFFLNTEVILPKIYLKKGTTYYVFTLVIIGIFVVFLKDYLRELISGKPSENVFGMHGIFNFMSVFSVIFTLGVSTAYGVFNLLSAQDKIRQEEQQERLRAELSFLRSQISPHFIFNVLNGIVYLIRSKSDRAEQVTIELSELIRYMLYESDDAQVSLEKEIKYLQNYIHLQKLRFEDDVVVEFDSEGVFTSQKIEPMLLIPFVENAFKHGVGMILDPIIQISIRFDEQNLWFTVKNKIAPETNEGKDSSSGIGLRNVSRRLELLYPHLHELTVEENDDWFAVNLSLVFKQ